MKKRLALAMAIYMMTLLPACSHHTPTPDVDNVHDTPIKGEEHIQETGDENIENIDDEEAPPLAEFAVSDWSFFYDDSSFDVQNDDPSNTILVLKPDSRTSTADDSVYFSVSFLDGTTAEDAVEKEEKDATSGNPTKDAVTINGETALHLHTEWGERAKDTVYDTFYLDADGGCYVITLCYYVDAAQTWGAAMNEMALSFHLL